MADPVAPVDKNDKIPEIQICDFLVGDRNPIRRHRDGVFDKEIKEFMEKKNREKAMKEGMSLGLLLGSIVLGVVGILIL